MASTEKDTEAVPEKGAPKKKATKNKATKRSAVLKLTLVRSLIGSTERQRAVVRGLGLRRIRHTVERQDTPEIRGMVTKVLHLVEVVEG